jgi:hypothetical protein
LSPSFPFGDGKGLYFRRKGIKKKKARERKERKPCSLSRGKIRDKGSKIVLGNIVLLFRFFKERKKAPCSLSVTAGVGR